MLRLVVIVLIVLIAVLVALRLVRELRGARIDWCGIAFMAAFVVLAFYLRHVTGMA